MKYFSKPIASTFVLIGVVLFFGSLVLFAHQKSWNIENGKSEHAFIIETIDHSYSQDNGTIIGSTDKYIFLLTLGPKQKVQVVPTRNVLSMSIMKVPWTVSHQCFFGHD